MKAKEKERAYPSILPLEKKLKKEHKGTRCTGWDNFIIAVVQRLTLFVCLVSRPIDWIDTTLDSPTLKE